MRKRSLLALPLAVVVVAGAAACLDPEAPVGETVPTSEGGPPDALGPPDAIADSSIARQHYPTGGGLKLTISKAAIDASGTVTVTFTVTDGAGLALDLSGKYSDGAVSPKFVVSWLAEDATGRPLQYTSYTKQDHTSTDGTKHALMPDADTGGAITEVGAGDGTYVYTFGTKVPPGFDAAKTHTVGVWAFRDLGGRRYVVNSLFDFVPNGSPVTTKRDIVNTQACNQCHNPLAQHDDGTMRREVRLCVLCHSAQAVDVNNGNSLDMPTMVHKIHRGRFLPSVIAGAKYQLTASGGALRDFSATWFPGEIQNCATCHKGSQSDAWKTNPSRALCGACHDRTSFASTPPAGMIAHSGGPETGDARCSTCHIPTPGTTQVLKELSVVDVHMTAATDPNAPKIDLVIRSVANTGPGLTPELHFSVTKNGQPLDILAAPLTSLAVTLAGPTTDYANAQPLTYTIQGGAVTGTLAVDGAVGSYTYGFPAPIPADATGTYAVGMEGYLQPDPGKPVRYASLNPVAYVAVTDPAPVPRRPIVERAKCNSCHNDLSGHGGSRRSPEYCVLCHTPNKVNDQGVERYEVPATTASSVNFKVLVHKTHRGNQLEKRYVLGGDPPPTIAKPGGTPIDFGTVAFPGNLRACWACHSGTSYMLPLPSGQLPTKLSQTLTCNDAVLDPKAYCASRAVASERFMSPVSAACTACHDSDSAAVHVQTMTASDGTEACETCHGSGKPSDVQVVHALQP